MMDKNCTVHFQPTKLRGEIYRVINPESLEVISVNFPFEELLTHFPGTPIQGAAPDQNGEFRMRIPTTIIEPDKDVGHVPFYYTIGNNRDASPLGLDMFKWYETKSEEVE